MFDTLEPRRLMSVSLNPATGILTATGTPNDDSITATSDWLWMTLMRLNRKAEAAKVLERITP